MVPCYRAGSFAEVTANAVYTFYSQIRMVDGNEYYQTMEKYEKVAGDIKAEDGSAFTGRSLRRRGISIRDSYAVTMGYPTIRQR